MFPKLLAWLKAHFGGLIITLGLIAVILVAYQAFQDKQRLFEELIGQKEAYKQLSEHAAKLEIQYKDQKALQAELEKNWKNEKGALEGRVKILSNATYLIREAARVSGNSDLVYENGPVKYVFNEIRFKEGPPIGYVLIFDDGRVTSKIYNHIIDVKTAVARDESSGRYSIVSKADFVLKSPHLSQTGPNWLNVPYPLKIVGGTAFVDPTEPNTESKHFLIGQVLNGGVLFGFDVKPSIGVSLGGYGYSVRDLDWKFLEVGVDYSKATSVGLHLTPILYRPLPSLLRNTYLGVGVGIDERPGYNPYLSLSIGF